MEKILTFKHWQLFILLATLGFWFSNGHLAETVGFLGLISFTLWAFAIGYYGQKQVAPLDLQPMNTPLFVFSTIFILFTILTDRVFPLLDPSSFEWLNYALPVLNLLAAIAGLQVLFFASKTLAKIEFGREIKFEDYFGNFIQMVVFIWGIWIIQPKINRLFAGPQPVL